MVKKIKINKKYINTKIYILEYIRRQWASFAHVFKTLYTTDITDLPVSKRTVFALIKSWLINVIAYGLLITFIYSNITNQLTILDWLKLTFAFGIARWLLFDAISELKHILGGKEKEW